MRTHVVHSLTTPVLSFEINGDDGEPIAFTAVTLTVTRVDGGAIINGRDEQDVLNANGVTITGALVEWQLTLDDTATERTEVRRARFVFQWGEGRQHVHDVVFFAQET